MKKVRSNKFKRRSLFIAYTAILIALNVTLKFLSIQIGSFSISFTYIPCFIAGMFLGPISGGMVGMLGDLIGTFAKSLAPSPLITLSCTLIGVIPGLIFMIKKVNPYIKLGISAILVLFACTLGLSSYGTWLVMSSGGSSKSFAAFWLIDRLPKQPIIMLINTVILYILYYPLKRFIFDKMGNKTTAETEPEYEIKLSDGTATLVSDGKNDFEGSENLLENNNNSFFLTHNDNYSNNINLQPILLPEVVEKPNDTIITENENIEINATNAVVNAKSNQHKKTKQSKENLSN